MQRVLVLHRSSAARFLVAGGLTFLVDIGTLRLLHGTMDVALPLATVAASGVAFLVNFTLTRRWTFAAIARSGDPRRQLIRYTALVFLNIGATVGLVVALSGMGLQYLVAKVVAAALNALANYFAYRYWVFV